MRAITIGAIALAERTDFDAVRRALPYQPTRSGSKDISRGGALRFAIATPYSFGT